jgi:hypothetical protein
MLNFITRPAWLTVGLLAVAYYGNLLAVSRLAEGAASPWAAFMASHMQIAGAAAAFAVLALVLRREARRFDARRARRVAMLLAADDAERERLANYWRWHDALTGEGETHS